MKNGNTKTRSVFLKVSMLLVFTMGLLVYSPMLSAQTVYKAGSIKVKVLGTSNLHDWEMVAEHASCDASFLFKSEELQDINSLDFSLLVSNLKSKESLLDKRAYKALKADQFNKITFKLSSASVTALPNKQYQLKTTGNLSIAGTTKAIVLNADGRLNPDGSLVVTGSKKLKMSDFQISPPSFMMGALKTADDLTISFTLKFNK